MSPVKSFLLDLWNDLRARRLLPVAALLIAALVAAPLVLSKKSETPTAPPAGTATAQGESAQAQGPEALAQVTLDESAGEGSSLSSFDADNPFAPPRKVVAAAEEEAGGGAEAPSGDTGTGAAPGGDTGGEAGGGETGGGTGGGETGGGETKSTEFTYVIDVTFWDNGRKRQLTGLDKLDVLPGQANPLLIFIGVTAGGAEAVFLVDSTLTASGEGVCKPSDADCATVEVGAGSVELFANDLGDTYRLRIDQIRKVKVEDEQPTAEAGAKAKKASAAVGRDGPLRRFVPPVLSDLVVETVGSDDNSTGAEKRR